MAVTKADIRILTILGIVIIGLLVVLLITNSSDAQWQQTTRQTYEYRHEELYISNSTSGELNSRIQYHLNPLGKDGWRVVGIIVHPNNEFRHLLMMREVIP